jgi:glycosyltransferase involved in cell wall biosynthesis
MKTAIRRVIFFSFYGPGSPSVRYRVVYPGQLLRSMNIRTHICFPGYSPRRIYLFVRAFFLALFASERTLIVIQRVHSNRIYANLLKILVRFSKARVAYDLDDADYLVYDPTNIHYFLKNVDVNFIGSLELNSYAKQFNENSLHLSSPTLHLNLTKVKRNATFTIGWIGCYGGGHESSLIHNLYPALKQLRTPVRFTILGIQTRENKTKVMNEFATCPNIELHFPDVDWLDETAVQQEILKFDLGIATLVDDELHRSKSAFKLKQYLNNGVPVLSSPLGENLLFLEDGLNGYFCSDAEAYYHRIQEFISMDDDTYAVFSHNAVLSAGVFEMEEYVRSMLANTADLIVQ